MATNEVTLQFPKTENEFRRLYEAGEFAVNIKNWLVEQGLTMGTDFHWAIDPDAREIRFIFDKDTSWASLVALKFSDK